MYGVAHIIAPGRPTRSLKPLAASLLLLGIGSAGLTHAQSIDFPTSSTLDIGSGTTAIDALTVANGVTGTIVGTGGTLNYLGGGPFVLGSTTSGAVQNLDMSGLSNFVFDSPAQSFAVGGRYGGSGNAANTSATLTLAANNVITASAFNVAAVASNAANAVRNVGTVNLGANTTINADAINVGMGAKTAGTLTFAGGGALVVRGTDGSSPVANWNIGINGASSLASTVGNVNLSGGSIDARVTSMLIGQASGGSQTTTGTLTLGSGALDATSIVLGQTGTAGTPSVAGTLTVGNATVSTQTLTMGDRLSSGGSVTATVNLNGGGTLLAQTIQAGAGTATRTFNWSNGTIGNYASGQDMTISIPTLSLTTTNPHNFLIEGADATASVSSVLSGAGGFAKAGAGILALSGTNTYSGGTTVNEGLIRFEAGANLGTGNVTLDGGGLQWAAGNTLDVSSRLNALGSNGAVIDTNGNNVTLASAMTGAGGQLVKQGAGTLTLTGDNTYDGTTYINAGDVVIGNGGNSGNIAGDVVNNTQLTINRSDTSTLLGSISGTGTLVQAGMGTTVLTGNNTYTGDTLVNAGSLQLGNGGTTGSLAGDVSLAAGTRLAVDRSDTSLLQGIVSGAGSFEQIGTGTNVIAGDNTYTGGTTISGGSLRLGNGGNSGSVVGDIVNGGTLEFNRADDVDVANAISGTGGLVQMGSGTLRLAGDQTYTGATLVQAGTLSIGGSIQSDTIVAPGATLAGVGVIHGNVLNEGMLWPGNPVAGDTGYGTLTIKGDYVGNNGLLALNTFLGDDDSPSSKLVIDGGNASGKTGVVVHNTSAAQGNTSRDGILVIATANGGTTDANAFALGNYARNGALSYRLFRGDLAGVNPDNWYLRNEFVVVPDPVDPTDPIDPVSPVPTDPVNPILPVDPAGPGPLPPGPYPIIGPELATYGVVQPVARELGMLTLGTMHQRAGDSALMLPAPVNSDAGPAVWTRAFASHIDNSYRAFAAPRARGDLNGLQVGADLWQGELIDGHSDRFGGYLAHSNADVRVRGLVTNEEATNYVMQGTGSVNLQANSAGVYWTHYGSNNWYLDGVLQASTYRGTASTGVARLDTNGVGFMGSLEFGYPFSVPQLGASFVLEPQVQAVWQNVRFGEQRDVEGSVALGNTNGTSGRIGLRGKWSVGSKGGSYWEPYVAVNYWRDWGARSTAVYDNKDSVPLLQAANRVEASGGVTARISANLSAYGSLGYQFGTGGTNTDKRDSFTAGAGLRYNW